MCNYFGNENSQYEVQWSSQVAGSHSREAEAPNPPSLECKNVNKLVEKF